LSHALLLERFHCENRQDGATDDAEDLQRVESQTEGDGCPTADNAGAVVIPSTRPKVEQAEYDGIGEKYNTQDEQVDSQDDFENRQILAKLLAEHHVQQVEDNIQEQHRLDPGEDESRNVGVVDVAGVAESIADAEGTQDELVCELSFDCQFLCILLRCLATHMTVKDREPMYARPIRRFPAPALLRTTHSVIRMPK
jgi:hypothetical protein